MSDAPDPSRGMNAAKTVQLTLDPTKGVGIGWTNMSMLEVLATLDLGKKAVLDMMAPERATPLIAAGGPHGAAQTRFAGRRVDQ